MDDTARFDIRLGLIVLGVFFLGFGGWAMFAPLDAAVVAPGVVVVSGNRQTIQHRDGGVVSRIAVVEGQRVRQGQLLIELNAPETIAQDRALFSQVIDLQIQRARLHAEIADLDRIVEPPEWSRLSPEDRQTANAALQRYTATSGDSAVAGVNWSEFDARIAGLRREAAAVGRQQTLTRQELASVRTLADEQLVAQTRVRALERSLAELDGRRAEIDSEIATTQQDRLRELRRVEARLDELSPQAISARAQLERTRLRAPAAGVVVGLSVHTVGGVVRGGERVMDIVPEGQDLVIESQVRPEDADDLVAGQSTQVRITAFGGGRLPIVHGVLQRVSADRFVDEHTGRGYFTVQVAVPPRELAVINQNRTDARRLRPGLPAQVVVRVRPRTALQYLLEPLDQRLWRSFRES